MKRRNALILGGATTVAATVGAAGLAMADPATMTSAADAAEAAGKIKTSFDKHSGKAGTWSSFITVVDSAGKHVTAVEQDADTVHNAASINKLAVALAVCDKVDRGELKLDDKIELDADIIAPGSGLYYLQAAFSDQLTVANVLVTMLLVSDNTAVRLCSKVCPGDEVNETLKAKGFTKTRVIPNEDLPGRFWLGETTPREMRQFLVALAAGELLSAASTRFLFGILRAVNGYHDGFRRNMSSAERSRVAMKYGADEGDRHEVGMVFNTEGAPVLVYSMFGQLDTQQDNYGGTHPIVAAHAAMGREMFDIVAKLDTKMTTVDLPEPVVAPGDQG